MVFLNDRCHLGATKQLEPSPLLGWMAKGLQFKYEYNLSFLYILQISYGPSPAIFPVNTYGFLRRGKGPRA
jgi:hypothetical protein